jgi:histone H3/H4
VNVIIMAKKKNIGCTAISPIRETMKKAGAEMVESSVPKKMRLIINDSIEEITTTSLKIARHANRKKIIEGDIGLALDLMGSNLTADRVFKDAACSLTPIRRLMGKVGASIVARNAVDKMQATITQKVENITKQAIKIVKDDKRKKILPVDIDRAVKFLES